MNGQFQMQGGKNWILPIEMNANRFFWDTHWLEIWSNNLCPSIGPNGGSVAMDSGMDMQVCPFPPPAVWIVQGVFLFTFINMHGDGRTGSILLHRQHLLMLKYKMIIL
jgi:hypothetical protein